MQEVIGNTREIRAPSVVAQSQLPERPFDTPGIPELVPDPKSKLPTVRFASAPESREERFFSTVEFPAKKRDDPSDLIKVSPPEYPTKLETPGNAIPAVKEEGAFPASEPALKDGRFLPIVLHLGSEEGKLVLQGSIPTRENTDAVYASAVKVFGEDSVENHLKYSPETIHAAWVDDLPEYVEVFFSHSAGDQELIIVDGILKLRGDVPSENVRNGLIALADSFRERGLDIDHELEVKKSLAGDLPELPGNDAASVEVSTEAEEKAAKLGAMIESGERIPDDGEPLIFYFETGSSEIVSSDQAKIVQAIQRAKVPRSIVYITAYADYRGDYELNRKLSLERAEKVRGLIFAGGVAKEVTAEIEAKGESQSAKAKTDEALKRSRRVVVSSSKSTI